MRKLFDQLAAKLRSFREQRDNLLLLIPCADCDVAFILLALRDLDRQSPADLYFLFADDFLSPGPYLTTLANRLQEELTLTNQATEQSAEKLPPLPTEMLDRRSPAPKRLEAGLRYARSLIDPRKGQRFIWGMGPMSISDPAGYLELLAQLPPRPEILPWMRGARIVARVPADFNLGESPLAKAKRVSVDPFVVPPNAHEEELLANAADPKMPVGERMQAEVQLADEWPSRHPLGSGLAIQQRKDVNLGHSLVHYEILTHSDGSLHELGHGAMGITFKAIDELSGRGRGPTSQHRLASSSVWRSSFRQMAFCRD